MLTPLEERSQRGEHRLRVEPRAEADGFTQQFVAPPVIEQRERAARQYAKIPPFALIGDEDGSRRETSCESGP